MTTEILGYMADPTEEERIKKREKNKQKKQYILHIKDYVESLQLWSELLLLSFLLRE